VNNILTFMILIILVIGLSGCTTEKPIGGERDEHGCLGPAGYTWNQDVEACLRDWESNENQKQAGKTAVDYIGPEKGLTILGVDIARCPGCFIVHLEKGKDRIDVTLENWEVKERSLTPDECIGQGGRNVNIVNGGNCQNNETNIGTVTGFVSPNICCVPLEYENKGEEAITIAKNYVRNMSEYRNFNGRNLKVIDIIQAKCPGCWNIELQFNSDSSQEEPIMVSKVLVKITLENWEVTDVSTAQTTVS